jgi:hypothetical protein
MGIGYGDLESALSSVSPIFAAISVVEPCFEAADTNTFLLLSDMVLLSIGHQAMGVLALG